MIRTIIDIALHNKLLAVLTIVLVFVFGIFA